MSVKLVFEYKGEDGIEMLEELCQYIIEELIPKYAEDDMHKLDGTLLVGFEEDIPAWRALRKQLVDMHKHHGHDHGTSVDIDDLDSLEDVVGEVKRQFGETKKRRKRKHTEENNNSGLSDFIDGLQ